MTTKGMHKSCYSYVCELRIGYCAQGYSEAETVKLVRQPCPVYMQLTWGVGT